MRKEWIYLFCILAMTLGMVSCKSHKKVSQYDDIYSEQTVKVKKDKSKKKDNNIGKRIAEEAKKWVGTPYGYGRSDKGVATDCSGLVVIVYRDIADIKLPRNSAQQAEYCKDLKEKEILPGDLVFFATGKDTKKVSHVGVMLDSEKFVHASTSKGVIISEMTTPYYRRTFIKYGRAL